MASIGGKYPRQWDVVNAVVFPIDEAEAAEGLQVSLENLSSVVVGKACSIKVRRGKYQKA